MATGLTNLTGKLRILDQPQDRPGNLRRIIGINQQTMAAVNARKEVLSGIYQSNECVNNIPVYTIEQIKQMIDDNQVKELQP